MAFAWSFSSLFEFASFPDWQDDLKTLAGLARCEKWNKGSDQFWILENYLKELFAYILRSQQTALIFDYDSAEAYFAVNLYSERGEGYEMIFALFTRANSSENEPPYVFRKWGSAADLADSALLPEPVSFAPAADVDTSLQDGADYDIFQPFLPLADSPQSIAAEVRRLAGTDVNLHASLGGRSFLQPAFSTEGSDPLVDCVARAVATLRLNRARALPCVDESGEVAFLAPLVLPGESSPACALLLKRVNCVTSTAPAGAQEYLYIGCVPLEAAYVHARLLNTVEGGWLQQAQQSFTSARVALPASPYPFPATSLESLGANGHARNSEVFVRKMPPLPANGKSAAAGVAAGEGISFLTPARAPGGGGGSDLQLALDDAKERLKTSRPPSYEQRRTPAGDAPAAEHMSELSRAIQTYQARRSVSPARLILASPEGHSHLRPRYSYGANSITGAGGVSGGYSTPVAASQALRSQLLAFVSETDQQALTTSSTPLDSSAVGSSAEPYSIVLDGAAAGRTTAEVPPSRAMRPSLQPLLSSEAHGNGGVSNSSGSSDTAVSGAYMLSDFSDDIPPSSHSLVPALAAVSTTASAPPAAATSEEEIISSRPDEQSVYYDSASATHSPRGAVPPSEKDGIDGLESGAVRLRVDSVDSDLQISPRPTDAVSASDREASRWLTPLKASSTEISATDPSVPFIIVATPPTIVTVRTVPAVFERKAGKKYEKEMPLREHLHSPIRPPSGPPASPATHKMSFPIITYSPFRTMKSGDRGNSVDAVGSLMGVAKDKEKRDKVRSSPGPLSFRFGLSPALREKDKEKDKTKSDETARMLSSFRQRIMSKILPLSARQEEGSRSGSEPSTARGELGQSHGQQDSKESTAAFTTLSSAEESGERDAVGQQGRASGSASAVKKPSKSFFWHSSPSTTGSSSSSNPLNCDSIAAYAGPYYSYEELVSGRLEAAGLIDPARKEQYLDEPTFIARFGCDRLAFYAQPQWKREARLKILALHSSSPPLASPVPTPVATPSKLSDRLTGFLRKRSNSALPLPTHALNSASGAATSVGAALAPEGVAAGLAEGPQSENSHVPLTQNPSLVDEEGRRRSSSSPVHPINGTAGGVAQAMGLPARKPSERSMDDSRGSGGPYLGKPVVRKGSAGANGSRITDPSDCSQASSASGSPTTGSPMRMAVGVQQAVRSNPLRDSRSKQMRVSRDTDTSGGLRGSRDVDQSYSHSALSAAAMDLHNTGSSQTDGSQYSVAAPAGGGARGETVDFDWDELQATQVHEHEVLPTIESARSSELLSTHTSGGVAQSSSKTLAGAGEGYVMLDGAAASAFAAVPAAATASGCIVPSTPLTGNHPNRASPLRPPRDTNTPVMVNREPLPAALFMFKLRAGGLASGVTRHSFGGSASMSMISGMVTPVRSATNSRGNSNSQQHSPDREKDAAEVHSLLQKAAGHSESLLLLGEASGLSDDIPLAQY